MTTRTAILTAAYAGIGLPLIAMLTALFVQLRRLKRDQDAMVETLSGSDTVWYRINVARPEHFARWLKLIGIEGKGLLARSGDRLRVVASLTNGERIDWTFPAQSVKTEWLGNSGIASSNLHWLSLRADGRALMLCADTGLNALQSREATADLLRKIDLGEALPDSAKADFALEKNPASLLAVTLFFALLAYAVVDGMFLNPYVYLGLGKARLAVVPLALTVGLPSYLLLSHRQVPGRESIALAYLLAVGVAVAFVPAIKRLDLALAGNAWHPMTFVKRGDTEYTAASPGGPPPVYVPRDKVYWKQYAVGDHHDFDVLRGPLGVWLLDPRKLEELADRYEVEHDDASAR